MNPGTSSALGTFIREQLEPILQDWEDFARSLVPLGDMNAQALRDHAQQMLICIADDMDRKQSETERRDKSEGSDPEQSANLDRVALLHGSARLKDEFTMVQLTAEFRAIRASVLRRWAASAPRAVDPVDEVTRFNEAIDQALNASVARYEARMDESRTMILGVLAHDLRSPLSSIALSMNYLLRSEETSSRGTKAAARALRGVDQMSMLISDLLDFTSARLGAGIPVVMEEANIGLICTKCVEDLEASYPGRVLRCELGGNLLTQCDPSRVSQLLTNLLTNALNHGDPSSDIVLRASGEEREVQVCIHNQGPPIPESVRAHLFEPLNRAVSGRDGLTGSSGLRLGLYIAQQIATAHKGTLTLRSSAIDGTTFTATFPRMSK